MVICHRSTGYRVVALAVMVCLLATAWPQPGEALSRSKQDHLLGCAMTGLTVGLLGGFFLGGMAFTLPFTTAAAIVVGTVVVVTAASITLGYFFTPDEVEGDEVFEKGDYERAMNLYKRDLMSRKSFILAWASSESFEESSESSRGQKGIPHGQLQKVEELNNKIARCYEQLGDEAKAAEYRDKAVPERSRLEAKCLAAYLDFEERRLKTWAFPSAYSAKQAVERVAKLNYDIGCYHEQAGEIEEARIHFEKAAVDSYDIMIDGGNTVLKAAAAVDTRYPKLAALKLKNLGEAGKTSSGVLKELEENEADIPESPRDILREH